MIQFFSTYDNVFYTIAAICFILGLKKLSHPKTARKGNFIAILGMFIAIAIAIFVGAFPGAIPVLLGWVAATNDFGLAAGILFAVQFCWQFPHFIAISWVMDSQYKKAGFKMMFGKE